MDKDAAVAVLDFEFLSTSVHGLCDPNTAVTSMGAFFFRPGWDEFVDRSNSFYAELDLDPQFALGRTVGKSTLHWWAGQPGFQQELEGTQHPQEALKWFAKWLIWHSIERVYAAPLQVDGPILVDLARAFDVELPIAYNSMRDVHTIVDLVDQDDILEAPFSCDKHNALCDAKLAAWNLYNALKLLT